MKITFHGAAGEVTGSQHLIEFGDRKILLDCGMFQGPRQLSREKNERFPYQPKDLDAVILSHAHMDHIGLLPRLANQGFKGPVFCTPSTADIATLMLEDSARLQVEDAAYLAKALGKRDGSILPLYEPDDLPRLTRLFEPCEFMQVHEVGKDVRLRFLPAGHILGSAIVELDLYEHGVWRRVVFSGDIGRRDLPLLKDPYTIERCDVLICESTYGNRLHPPTSDVKAELKQTFAEAVTLNGRVVIPAFSLGRTQQLVYLLNELWNDHELPTIPVFVDSPLATRLTKVFRRFMDEMDSDVQETRGFDRDIFGFGRLNYVATREESMQLNRRQGSFAVISASGMCEGGRVVHHIKNACGDPANTILIMGFQAEHTLGRQIVERRETIRIFGKQYPLKARVHSVQGLSGHADVHDFRWWFEALRDQGGCGQLFLVHGEPAAAQALAQTVRDCVDLDPIIPQLHESFEV